MSIIAPSVLIAYLNLSLNDVHSSNGNLVFSCEFSMSVSSPLQKKCSQSLCGVSREFSYCSCKKKLKALKHPLLGIYNPSAKDIGSVIGKREISCKKGKGKLRSSWKKGRLKTVI